MIRPISIVFFLMLLFQDSGLCFRPPIQFFDINNNGIIEPEESKRFEEERIRIFDKNGNGVLDADEMDTFMSINDKLSGGGERLEGLSEEQKNLYRDWRGVLLSLGLNNPVPGLGPDAINQHDIAKCYPDKVCDEPYGPQPGGPMPMLPPPEIGTQLIIFYAAGLNASMDGVVSELRKMYPSIEVVGESSGTLLAVRKITELNKEADVIFVADALAIKDMLMPKFADWYIAFYKDRVVLAYTERSKYTNEINDRNWYKILARKDVRFGYANPNLAPVGYRTLMTWQLADLYYKEKVNKKSIYEALKKACPRENIMPDVGELLHLLESLSLDYVFIYESMAKQHNLKYIQLPKEIDLGSIELSDVYKQAHVEITSGKKGKKETLVGSPILFALTILKDAPNYRGAIEFVRMFLGPEGQRIMASNDQTMTTPCSAFNPEKIPEELKLFISNEGK